MPSQMMEKWDLFKILAGLLRFLVSSIMSLEIEKDQIRDMFMERVKTVDTHKQD